MPECKHKAILSLTLKKLANWVDDLKLILVLQNEMLLLMLFCGCVLKQREGISRYGKTINNSFLGTVYSATSYANCLLKNILIDLSTKIVGKQFFFYTSFK